MPRIGSFIAGALGGAVLVYREHLHKQRAERLAAATLESLLKAIDANDAETGAHVRRVAAYALALADAMEVDEHALRMVERVALFHDIGKIHGALFDIVHDDDRLTTEERRVIATHPARGAQVLEPVSHFYPDLAEGVLSHHECWDGSGYPRGLRGTEIPLAARIVSIADTFDAITQRRRYRAGMSPETAAERIARGRGTQFEPDLVDLFLTPPVFEHVLEERRLAHAPRVVGSERRARGERVDGPDVTFRWRKTEPVRHARGRERRVRP
jgi:HD-GYP domain-containing protein (c-di-GMP phosphodiesterase class II)